VADDLEHARTADDPAGVLHHAPARRVPLGDHHGVREAHRADARPAGPLSSDALPAGHPGRPDPLALPGPVHRGPPDLLSPGRHADLRADLECAAHDLRLLTMMERSGGGRPALRPSVPAETPAWASWSGSAGLAEDAGEEFRGPAKRGGAVQRVEVITGRDD